MECKLMEKIDWMMLSQEYLTGQGLFMQGNRFEELFINYVN